MADHVCPWWVGYLLASPLRKLVEHHDKILKPYVRSGMTVADLGCAMGYFSLPAAKLVGPEGRVVCVDLQPRMLETLRKRARRAKLLDRLDLRTCPGDALGCDDLNGQVDVALAMYVVHETPDPPRFIEQIHALLKPGGYFIFSEPKFHVDEQDYRAILDHAQSIGYTYEADFPGSRSLGAVLRKNA